MVLSTIDLGCASPQPIIKSKNLNWEARVVIIRQSKARWWFENHSGRIVEKKMKDTFCSAIWANEWLTHDQRWTINTKLLSWFRQSLQDKGSTELLLPGMPQTNCEEKVLSRDNGQLKIARKQNGLRTVSHSAGSQELGERYRLSKSKCAGQKKIDQSQL